jgi:AraC-like DNA-binding protein
MISILNGLLIFGIIQVFVFSGLLISKKERNTSDLIMITWLLSFAIHSFLILVNLNSDNSALVQSIPVTLPLLYGPLLFIYVKEFIPKRGKASLVSSLHFIPFAIFLLFTFFFSDNFYFTKILSLSGAVSGLVYCLLTSLSIKMHENQIVNLYSTTKGISLNWLNKLVKGIFFIWGGIFILVVTKQVVQVNINLNWFFILIPLFISYIGYYGLKQQVIIKFVQNDNVKESLSDVKSIPEKIKPQNKETAYKKSGLQEQDMKRIFGTLESLMKSEQLYLEPELNLKDLSEKSNTPQHHITQTLNSFAKLNFYDYVNAFRINEFKKRIKSGDAENYSLLGIAFDCGFNSKSTFNRIFKKNTRLSPSEYKKQIDINS